MNVLCAWCAEQLSDDDETVTLLGNEFCSSDCADEWYDEWAARDV